MLQVLKCLPHLSCAISWKACAGSVNNDPFTQVGVGGLYYIAQLHTCILGACRACLGRAVSELYLLIKLLINIERTDLCVITKKK